jgi:hypothetical protein
MSRERKIRLKQQNVIASLSARTVAGCLGPAVPVAVSRMTESGLGKGLDALIGTARQPSAWMSIHHLAQNDLYRHGVPAHGQGRNPVVQ